MIHCDTAQGDTSQCITVQCDAVLYSTAVQCSAVQYSTVQYSTRPTCLLDFSRKEILDTTTRIICRNCAGSTANNAGNTANSARNTAIGAGSRADSIWSQHVGISIGIEGALGLASSRPPSMTIAPSSILSFTVRCGSSFLPFLHFTSLYFVVIFFQDNHLEF